MSERLAHWVHDEPDSFEAKVGVMYCRRCGRPVRQLDGTPMSGAGKPCEFVKVELR